MYKKAPLAGPSLFHVEVNQLPVSPIIPVMMVRAAPIIVAPAIVSVITPVASTVVDRWRSIVTRRLIHDRRGRSPPTERVEIDSDARVGMGGARGERERDQAK
jgi:hypothetical protein